MTRSTGPTRERGRTMAGVTWRVLFGGAILRGRRRRVGAGSERGRSERCDFRAQDPHGCDRPQHGRAGRNDVFGKGDQPCRGTRARRRNFRDADGVSAPFSAEHESMAAERRSGSRERHLRVSRRLDEIRGFLRASRQRFESGLQHQPCGTGSCVQELRCESAHRLRLLPRSVSKERAIKSMLHGKLIKESKPLCRSSSVGPAFQVARIF
jgi:hypothetical protein